MTNPNWQHDSTWPCRYCNQKDCVDYRLVEDAEGHEDVNYRCTACNKTWWVDGIDS